jgi:hypothetical protein
VRGPYEEFVRALAPFRILKAPEFPRKALLGISGNRVLTLR